VPDDPYGFNGFLRVHLHFTPAQRQRMQHFPPLPIKKMVNAAEFSEFMQAIQAHLQDDLNIHKVR
jgi:hypothetical protein